MKRFLLITILTISFLLNGVIFADIGKIFSPHLWHKIENISHIPLGQTVEIAPDMPDIWGELHDLSPSKDGGFYFRKDGYIYLFNGAVTTFGLDVGLVNIHRFIKVEDTFYCLKQTSEKPRRFDLVVYSLLRAEFRSIPLPQDFVDKLLPSEISLYSVKSGVIWCGNHNSGLMLSWDGKRWAKVDWQPELQDQLKGIESFNDPMSTILVSGLLKRELNRFHFVYTADKLQISLPDNLKVRFLIRDQKDNFWGEYLNTTEKPDYGLFRFNGVQFNYYPLQPEDRTTANDIFLKADCQAAMDNKGRIWFWWGSGIFAPRLFTLKDGFYVLPRSEFIPHQRLKAVIPTPYGYIWMVGEDFLSGINDSQNKDDTRAPNTYFLKPPQEYIIGESYTFFVGASDYFTSLNNIEFSVKLNKRGWSDYVPIDQFPIPVLMDGPHHFIVRARDPSGNVDFSPAKIDFWVNPHQSSLRAETVEFATNNAIYSAHHRYFKDAITEKGRIILQNVSPRSLNVYYQIDIPGISENPFRTSQIIEAGSAVTLPFELSLNKNIIVKQPIMKELEITFYYQYDKIKGQQFFDQTIIIEPPQMVFWDNPGLVSSFIQADNPQFSNLIKQIERDTQVFYIYGDNVSRAVLFYEALNVWGFKPNARRYQTINPAQGYFTWLQLPTQTLNWRRGSSLELTTLYATLLVNAGIRVQILESLNEPFLLVDSALDYSDFEDIFKHTPFEVEGDTTAWLPVWVSSMANSFYHAVSEAWPLIDGQDHLVIDPAEWEDNVLGLWPQQTVKIESDIINTEALRVRLIRNVEYMTPEKKEFYSQAIEYMKNLSIFTTDMELKNEAAYFFTRNGYFELSINILKRSFTDPKICANLGLLMLIKGNLTQAEHYLSLALSYNPDNEKVKQAITMLNWQTTDVNLSSAIKPILAPSNYIQHWSK